MLSALKLSLAPQLIVRKVKIYRGVTCWKCGTEAQSSKFFCKSNPCGVVQPFDLKDINAFHLFHMDQKYFIDMGVLESEYKNIQKQLHPDMFANHPVEEREASLQTSSTINQAYQILKSPIARAEYLLKLQFGIDAFEEGKTLSSVDNNSLMMEIFELRDQVNDTDSAADLMRLHHNIEEDIGQIEKAFASSVEAGNESQALRYAVRLKYFGKVLDEIEAKLPPAQ